VIGVWALREERGLGRFGDDRVVDEVVSVGLQAHGHSLFCPDTHLVERQAIRRLVTVLPRTTHRVAAVLFPTLHLLSDLHFGASLRKDPGGGQQHAELLQLFELKLDRDGVVEATENRKNRHV
jgi:hypothetical protein